MGNRKKMFVIFGILSVVLLIGGITYAWFNYRGETADKDIIAGDISLKLNEGDEEITLTNVFPESAESARSKDNNYITFDITGTNTSNKTIYYEIILDYGSEKASPKQRYNDEDLVFDLVELDDNGDEIDYLVSGESFDSLNNKRIYVDTVDANTSGEVERHYKLRMWLSEDVIISDSEQDANYTTTEFRNGYATVKLIVAGDFQEKAGATRLYDEIQRLSSTESYIRNYSTSYSSLGVQDTVGVNNDKKTVYYYKGADAKANGNVMFAGYCWQIVRTTDTGGVKLVYNGVAQKTETNTTTTMSDNDITFIDGDEYNFIYDSSTGKWQISAPTHSSVMYEFSVNVAGDYILNYSAETGQYDIMTIYKNDTLIRQTKEREDGSIDLKSLSTTDEIKIEYERGDYSSTNENGEFELLKVTNREESDNVECGLNRWPTKVVEQRILYDGIDMSSVSAFGRSFDYNIETGVFTIEDYDGLPTAWSTNDTNNNGIEDYQELIQTYTCLSNSRTCDELYYIYSRYSSSSSLAYTYKYNIELATTYTQIGKNAFNNLFLTSGYMYNKTFHSKMEQKSGEYYSSVTWNGTTYSLTNGNSGTSPDSTHHYICDTDCTKVRYYYYIQGSSHYYILLENGDTIEDEVYKMTGSGTSSTKSKATNAGYNINLYSSSIKQRLELWYQKNLINYAKYIDSDTVYCSDRSIYARRGFNPDGGSLTATLSSDITFRNGLATSNLTCPNDTDRFSVANVGVAELTYPIGLLTRPEVFLMESSYASTGKDYWTLSPWSISSSGFIVFYGGDGNSGHYSSVASDVRPVITLKPGTKLKSGTGTYSDPYVIGPIVTRNEAFN